MTLKGIRREANIEMAFPTFRSRSDSFSIECNSHFFLLWNYELRAILTFLIHCCDCINTSVISNGYPPFILVLQCDYIYYKYIVQVYIHTSLCFIQNVSNIQHGVSFTDLVLMIQNSVKVNLVFFQNEEIFVQSDELDEFDKITHA